MKSLVVILALSLAFLAQLAATQDDPAGVETADPGNSPESQGTDGSTAEGDSPAGGSDGSTAEGDSPAGGTDGSTAEGDSPAGGSDGSTAEGDSPAGGTDGSTAEGDSPTGGSDGSTAEGDSPAGGSDGSTAEGDSPAGGTDGSTAEGDSPAGGSDGSTAEGDSPAGGTDGSTAEGDSPAGGSPDESVAEGNSTASEVSDNTPEAEANNTMTEDTPDSSSTGNETIEEAPSNMVAAGNMTEESNSTSGETSEEGAMDTAEDPASYSEKYMTIFGIPEECADVIDTCYGQGPSTAFRQFMYCGAFALSEDCVAGNETSGNATSLCSPADVDFLRATSCGPSDLNLDVTQKCKARVTQCTAKKFTSGERMDSVSKMLFEKKMCKTVEDGDCLEMENDGAVCSTADMSTIKIKCSNGAAGLLSSAFLLALMLVATRLM